jgi:hypothetical protein
MKQPELRSEERRGHSIGPFLPSTSMKSSDRITFAPQEFNEKELHHEDFTYLVQ